MNITTFENFNVYYLGDSNVTVVKNSPGALVSQVQGPAKDVNVNQSTGSQVLSTSEPISWKKILVAVLAAVGALAGLGAALARNDAFKSWLTGK